MKYAHIPQLVVDMMSPPSRGAWIEIQEGKTWQRTTSVAPLAGGVD